MVLYRLGILYWWLINSKISILSLWAPLAHTSHHSASSKSPKFLTKSMIVGTVSNRNFILKMISWIAPCFRGTRNFLFIYKYILIFSIFNLQKQSEFSDKPVWNYWTINDNNLKKKQSMWGWGLNRRPLGWQPSTLTLCCRSGYEMNDENFVCRNCYWNNGCA
jgi:hypothetical protein